jgi:antitoxin component of RelBE/YafQ-DinJ toxin-antitoxin module
MTAVKVTVDERVAERARQAAKATGKSLNQAVRNYLEQLAGAQQREAEVRAFEASALATQGRLSGWTFDREDANKRR